MSSISVLAISDVHLGCPRLNPVSLHERLLKYLYPLISKDIKILFICGDFFDSLLNLNSMASLEAMRIIDELTSICIEVGCDLRVLRGTFTHDRNQPQHFINGRDPNDTRVRLFDKLSLEYHEPTGLYILYIPDNLSSKDIYGDIRTILDSKGVDKADIIISHGYFAHLLPKGVPEPHGCLDVDKIQNYVRGCVLNGHVHLTSILKNVISVGSFDRLSHGEEGPKGFYRIDIEDGVYKFNFIENKDASKFLTFDLRRFGTEANAAMTQFQEKWQKVVDSLQPNELVHLRVASDDEAIIAGCIQLAKTIYPNVFVDKAPTTRREQIVENVNLGLEELPIITQDNLAELLVPIIQKGHPSTTLDTVKEVLNACSE